MTHTHQIISALQEATVSPSARREFDAVIEKLRLSREYEISQIAFTIDDTLIDAAFRANEDCTLALPFPLTLFDLGATSTPFTSSRTLSHLPQTMNICALAEHTAATIRMYLFERMNAPDHGWTISYNPCSIIKGEASRYLRFLPEPPISDLSALAYAIVSTSTIAEDVARRVAAAALCASMDRVQHSETPPSRSN